MRKLITLIFLPVIFFISLPIANAQTQITTITSGLHQNFTGQFIDNALAQELTPSGRLGQLVFTLKERGKVWMIDPALIDEVLAMSNEYKVIDEAPPVSKNIATSWLLQLKKITSDNDVVALAYGNPDIAMAARLAPSELKLYYAFGKSLLETELGRVVRSQAGSGLRAPNSRFNDLQLQNYGDARRDLTALSKVVASDEIYRLRMRLARLLSPQINSENQEYFLRNLRLAVDLQLNRLRVNPGKYQITTERSSLPVTVINDFPVAVVVNIQMVAMNGRVVVDRFTDIKLAPNSKLQLGLSAHVIAPGETTVIAQITDKAGDAIVPPAVLALNATVIDPRVTWFTTGAAILLLLAAIAQSVRRVRRGRAIES